MGITGLLPFLKDATEDIHIKKYSGQVVAVDTYCWIHKGSFACAEKLAKKEHTDQYVKYCMKYISLLESYRVKPILVFDGCRLPSKEHVEQERHKRRKVNFDKGKQFLREGNVNAARDCFTKCISVTPAMALNVIEAARKRGVDCIVAPYEADAQLAYLSKTGIAQAIVTEDSDLLCFGCKNVIFKMDQIGKAQEISMQNLGRVKNLVGFTPDLLRHMCILSGCDYLQSVKGVGLVKACKALKLSKSKDSYQVARKLHQYVKGIPQVDPSYGPAFERADKTFLYQLVYDPQQRKIRPLIEYPPGITAKDLEYAGPLLSDETAFQISVGNVDINTKQVIAHFNVDDWIIKRKAADKRPSIWGNRPMQKPCLLPKNDVFLEQPKEVKATLKKDIGHTKAAVPDKQKVLSADDVLEAVTDENSSLDDVPSKKIQTLNNVKTCHNVSKVNSQDMADILDSYSSTKQTATKEKHCKSSKHQIIVKSRFFASPNSSLKEEFVDHVSETDRSSIDNTSNDTSITNRKNASCEDAVLNEILTEMTMQSESTPSPAKRKNPFSKTSSSASKRQNTTNSNFEMLQTFSHRTKKKLPNVSFINPTVTASTSSPTTLSDESIPILDNKNLKTEPDTDNLTNKIDIAVDNNSGSDDSSLQDEDIPILDRSAIKKEPTDVRMPLTVVADENCSIPQDRLAPAKSNVISVSSSEEEENERTSEKPPKKTLGVRKAGHFSSPVKLNLSKYFTGAKASGLRKRVSKKKKISNVQPSIKSFFQKT